VQLGKLSSSCRSQRVFAVAIQARSMIFGETVIIAVARLIRPNEKGGEQPEQGEPQGYGNKESHCESSLSLRFVRVPDS
jgi:hypothetical protein